MPRHTEPSTRTSGARRRLLAAGQKGRHAVRKIAHGTLLAAGIAATQMAPADGDPRFHLFNPAVLDRLQAPITRHRE